MSGIDPEFADKFFKARESGFAFVCLYCGAGLDESRQGRHEPGCSVADVAVAMRATRRVFCDGCCEELGADSTGGHRECGGDGGTIVLTDYEWLGARLFVLHNQYAANGDPCQCGFCRHYRDLHGENVDPWCGPYETLEVVYR